MPNLLNHFSRKQDAVACVAAYLGELQEQVESVKSLRKEKTVYNNRLHTQKKSLAAISKNKPDLDVKYGFRSPINGDWSPMGDVTFYIYNNADSFVTEEGFIFCADYDVLQHQVFSLGPLYGALCGMHNYLDTECADKIHKHAKDKKQMDDFTEVMHNIQHDLENFAIHGFKAFAPDGWCSTAMVQKFANHFDQIEKYSNLVTYFPEKIRTKSAYGNPFCSLNIAACGPLASCLQLEQYYISAEHDRPREFIELVLTELQAYCPPLSLKLHYAYSTTAIQHMLAQPQYKNLQQDTKAVKTKLAQVYVSLPKELIRHAGKLER
ncbi:MAG: hypothetical protein J6Y07_01730 [Alphaproteobacteria bacterium]|nr:hypothetical protein [Alphaproteobacteria bacterium]